MTNSKLRFAALLLMLGCGPLWAADQTKPATEAQAIDPAYAKNLHDIFNVQALHKSLTSLAAVKKGGGINGDINRAFVAQITVMELEWRIRPALASVASPEFASELAEQMNKPAYRRWETLGEPTSNYLTKDEIQQLSVINSSKAMLEWRALDPKLKGELRKVMLAWKAEYVETIKAKTATAYQQLGKMLEAPSRQNDEESAAPAPVGIESIDRYIANIASAVQKLMRARRSFEHRIRGLDVGRVVTTQGMATSEDIARSMEVVDKAESELETFLIEIEKAWSDHERVANELLAQESAAFKETNSARFMTIYGDLLDFGEACRRVFAIDRRLLTFMQSRVGAFTVKDDQILFNDPADLNAVEQIQRELMAARGEVRRKELIEKDPSSGR